MAYFPMFLDLCEKKCLVVGGGRIALHKIQVLRDFDACVKVVATDISGGIRQLAMEDGQILCEEREFEVADLADVELVVAATDNKEMNHQVATLCREQKIPVNAVDQQEDCDFIFPSYVREGDVVGAFSSGGKSPVITQYLKQIMASKITPQLAEIADIMGAVRNQVKAEIPENMRRQAYQELLEWCLKSEKVPSGEEVQIWLERKKL